METHQKDAASPTPLTTNCSASGQFDHIESWFIDASRRSESGANCRVTPREHRLAAIRLFLVNHLDPQCAAHASRLHLRSEGHVPPCTPNTPRPSELLHEVHSPSTAHFPQRSPGFVLVRVDGFW